VNTITTTHLYWLIILIFLSVIVIEYSTPSEYVFGYLYTGAILLANYHRHDYFVKIVTLIAGGLTLLNLLIPVSELDCLPTITNRIIAFISLLITGWLTIRNRTYEQQIARQQAQIQSQAKLTNIREDFVSTLTHDLKTPLLGAMETLKSFQAGFFGQITPKQTKVLEILHQSHLTTLQLVETVLDIYRNDLEGLQLNQEPVNIVMLWEEILTNLLNLAQSRQIYLSLRYKHADKLWVMGDSFQLRRVFVNLLSNAINHSPRGSKVKIMLKLKENEVQILVKDQGLGIPPEQLPYLFERFYQGDSTRGGKGSGLGLYLSRQIVAAHGGKIWAENCVPQGAIFACSLPLYSELTSL
jgi:two-component system NarL family sensor kinase